MGFPLFLHRDGIKFIQVGAANGTNYDPIHSIVKGHKWKGILIEPYKNLFITLKEHYLGYHDNLIFENIAIHEHLKTVTLYTPTNAFHSSISRRHKGIRRYNDEELKKISSEVPALTLDEVIEKHSFPSIDLLQIDAETYDFGVIKSLSIEKYRPQVIRYEYAHLRKQHQECARYLSDLDYILSFENKEDIMAISRTCQPLHPDFV